MPFGIFKLSLLQSLESNVVQEKTLEMCLPQAANCTIFTAIALILALNLNIVFRVRVKYLYSFCDQLRRVLKFEKMAFETFFSLSGKFLSSLNWLTKNLSFS